MTRLFHVSEEPGLTRFEPRPDRDGRAVVWAISNERLHNYLLPRDCPRVTFYALKSTSESDRRRFLGDASNVIAIETAWVERVHETVLYIYEFTASLFELEDPIAGYYTSDSPQQPVSEVRVASAMTSLTERNVEVRVLDSLWVLREDITNSSLGYSIIRFRNAGPPPPGFRSRYPVPGIQV